jgi:hypothetical protein
VFEPAPILIGLSCNYRKADKDNTFNETNAIDLIDLTQEKPFSIYKYRRVENPQRGFFTAPHDGYTMQDGMLTGHKYSSQSYVKGFFDFATTPIKAAMPTTATSTQIQTGGGKPDQTTQTTTYTYSPN